MARQQETEIPVYVFMGFLDSGKTTFVKETLLDREFTGGAKTLLLVCEDGEEGYVSILFLCDCLHNILRFEPEKVTKKEKYFSGIHRRRSVEHRAPVRSAGQISAGAGYDRIQWYVEAG